MSDAGLVQRLVDSDATSGQMVQGYLLERDDRVLRVRLTRTAATLTLKGPRLNDRRVELETSIEVEMAEHLLHLCEDLCVYKIRYPLVDGGHTWTVDVFLHENRGLVLAEIEDPPDDLRQPLWCSEDVTDDERFYNLDLSKRPFNEWSDRQRWEIGWRGL